MYTHSHSCKLMIRLTGCAPDKLLISNISCTSSIAGEVCSSRVGAGPTEEDPVIRVPPEEASRRALGSPTLPRRQGAGALIDRAYLKLDCIVAALFMLFIKDLVVKRLSHHSCFCDV